MSRIRTVNVAGICHRAIPWYKNSKNQMAARCQGMVICIDCWNCKEHCTCVQKPYKQEESSSIDKTSDPDTIRL